MDRFHPLRLRVGLALVFVLLPLLSPPGAVFDASPAVLGKAEDTLPASASAALRTSATITQTLFLPLVIGPAFTVRTPNPVDLTMTLDSSRATTATLPLDGGTLTVNEPTLAADRPAGAASTTQFQLTIPPGALLYTTTVVMTPISTVIGLSPTVHFIAGVHIEPQGLRLFNLATLTITPSMAVPITQQVPIASHALGQSSFLYPLQLGTPQIVLSLMVFNEYSLARGENDPIPVEYNPNNIPLLPEDQYMAAVAQLVQLQRVAEQTGQPGDPNFTQKLIQLNRGYYNNVLLKQLDRALVDCWNAQSLLLPAFGWSHQVQLSGLGDALASEIADVDNKGLQAAQKCWNKLKCVHWHIPSEVQKVLSLARQLQLLTDASSNQYDPSGLPECPCATITSKSSWSGQMTLSYNRTVTAGGQQVTVNESSSGSAQLNGPTYAGNLTGSVVASYSQYNNGLFFASYHGGPLVPFTPPNLGSHMILYLHPDTCTYLYWIGVRATVTWNDNSQSVADVGTVVGGQHALSDYDSVLSGGGDVAAHSSAFIAASNLSTDYFVSDRITDVAGENAGGTAQVAWTFTPGP